MLKRQIIRQLCQNGSMSIADIASAVNASVPTTTKYLSLLEASGWVVGCGRSGPGHGRRPKLYDIRSGGAYFLGVDPKHGSLSLALMDLSGRTVAEKEEKIIFENTPEMMETICLKCEDFIDGTSVSRDSVRCAAFNISGRVDHRTGRSHTIFNFENNEEPLSDILSHRLGFKVLIDNDTRLMSYGELCRKEGYGLRNFLFVNVGWGIGLSIIIDGKVYYGTNGFSGEFGHTSIYDNEIMCHCGKKGCLETEVSGRAICSRLRDRIGKGESSILRDRILKGTEIDEYDVIDAAMRDDMLSIEVIERAGSELGRQIANLINLFNPEAVIIGGSLQAAGDIFVSPLKLSVRRYSLRLISQNVTIKTSALGEKGGCTGACLKARDETLKVLGDETLD
ncbi:MAG: ROK family transcriptional regulator [Bacteroidales bacterium]|nr:ROK family transcriptional regulator [Bacteroidales bacterium]